MLGIGDSVSGWVWGCHSGDFIYRVGCFAPDRNYRMELGGGDCAVVELCIGHDRYLVIDKLDSLGSDTRVRREIAMKEGGVGFAGLLFMVFLVLKLTGVIDWSWWWVTAPLWGAALLAVITVLVVAIIVTVSAMRSK